MNYILCTSQRSGQTWLCKTLHCLGIGKPDEYVNIIHNNETSNKLSADLLHSFKNNGIPGLYSAIARHQLQETKSNIAGLAVQWNQLEYIANHCSMSGRDAFLQLLEEMKTPHIFFLVREDILSQAISHYLLHYTGYAHSFSPLEKKNLRSEVVYNGKEILEWTRFTLRSYNSWINLFKKCNIELNILRYEDIKNNPLDEFQRIAMIIDPDFKASSDKIIKCSNVTAKIGDGVNQRFRDTLIHDTECGMEAADLLSQFKATLIDLRR